MTNGCNQPWSAALHGDQQEELKNRLQKKPRQLCGSDSQKPLRSFSIAMLALLTLATTLTASQGMAATLAKPTTHDAASLKHSALARRAAGQPADWSEEGVAAVEEVSVSGA